MKKQQGTISPLTVIITVLILLGGVFIIVLLTRGEVNHNIPSQKQLTSAIFTPIPSSSSVNVNSSSPSVTNATTPSKSNTPLVNTSYSAVAIPAPFASQVSLHSRDFVIALGGQTSASFQRAVNALNNVSASGVNKLISFNSISDLNTYISQVPSDVTYIAYDTEQSYTPSSELDSLASSVSQFSQIVHAHGKKMVWVPQYSYFDNAESNGTLSSILSSVDMVIYQSQKLLTAETNYTQDMQNRYRAAKAANPKILFYLQLWVGTNGSTDQQIINGFNSLVGYYDIAGWGGGFAQDTATIYEGLSFRK